MALEWRTYSAFMFWTRWHKIETRTTSTAILCIDNIFIDIFCDPLQVLCMLLWAMFVHFYFPSSKYLHCESGFVMNIFCNSLQVQCRLMCHMFWFFLYTQNILCKSLHILHKLMWCMLRLFLCYQVKISKTQNIFFIPVQCLVVNIFSLKFSLGAHKTPGPWGAYMQ